MIVPNERCLSRRTLLRAGAGVALAGGAPSLRALGGAREFRLVAATGRVALVGAPHPDTDVWAYNGTIPGPEIRARQGDRLRVVVENRLREGTTVHWHGVRVPNATDRAGRRILCL
jgi:FtsP/CotA-like multicopper oxidase with cupredoxin domain